MSVSTVTKPLTTPALCDLMFCHIQRTNLISAIILLVEKPLTILVHSGKDTEYNFVPMCDDSCRPWDVHVYPRRALQDIHYKLMQVFGTVRDSTLVHVAILLYLRFNSQ